MSRYGFDGKKYVHGSELMVEANRLHREISSALLFRWRLDDFDRAAFDHMMRKSFSEWPKPKRKSKFYRIGRTIQKEIRARKK